MTTSTFFSRFCAASTLLWLAGGVCFVSPNAAIAQAKPASPPKEDGEVKMGREAHEEMLRSGLKLVKDPALVARVENIGKKLADIANATNLPATYGSADLVPYQYKFFIVDDPDVNAFSLPGGYIYINKGLLNYVQSDDELAGVLGHEIEHAHHHHVNRLQKEQNKLSTQMALGALAAFLARVPTNDAFNLLQGFQLVALQKVSGYSQSAERDADKGGVIFAEKGGYNPVGMLTFMERLARDQRMRPDVELGIFRTHPPEKERVANITTQISGMGLPIHRRAVTNMMKVTVRSSPLPPDAKGNPADKLVYEVLLDGKPLYRTPSQTRSKNASETLNRLLDQDVQLFDITRRGATVSVRGETVFALSQEDVDLPGSSSVSVDAATEATYKNLRNAVYRYLLQTGY